MKRAARRNGIRHPFQISTEELKICLKMCDERNNYFRKNGSRYRKKHLLQRVEVARREEPHEAAKMILTIIKQEQDRDFWRRLNYTCGKTKGGSPTSVQVSAGGDDQYTEYDPRERTQSYLVKYTLQVILSGRGSPNLPRPTTSGLWVQFRYCHRCLDLGRVVHISRGV